MNKAEISVEPTLSPELEHYHISTPYISIGETSGGVDHSHHDNEELKAYNKTTVYFLQICLIFVNITISYYVFKQQADSES